MAPCLPLASLYQRVLVPCCRPVPLGTLVPMLLPDMLPEGLPDVVGLGAGVPVPERAAGDAPTSAAGVERIGSWQAAKASGARTSAVLIRFTFVSSEGAAADRKAYPFRNNKDAWRLPRLIKLGAGNPDHLLPERALPARPFPDAIRC